MIELHQMYLLWYYFHMCKVSELLLKPRLSILDFVSQLWRKKIFPDKIQNE